MAQVQGILPQDYNEAALVGELTNRENDFNGLMEELTSRVKSTSIEGKLYRNVASFDMQKIEDQCDDLPKQKSGGYGVRFNKCDYGGQAKLTPDERKYGKNRVNTVMESIYRGKGQLLDRHFMDTLCKPVVFCPPVGGDGRDIVVNDFMVIDPINEAMTPDKIKKSIQWLRGGNGGQVDPIMLSSWDALQNLDEFDAFKSFDCTYGKGSSLWGDVSRFPDYKGLTFREVVNNANYKMDGTDALVQTPIIPVSPNLDANGNIDPNTEVHWVPVYDRDVIAYELSRELCVSMKENLPGKMKDLLLIDAEFGFGTTKWRTKGVIWIGVLVEKNPCVEWKVDPFASSKFPKIVDGFAVKPDSGKTTKGRATKAKEKANA